MALVVKVVPNAYADAWPVYVVQPGTPEAEAAIRVAVVVPGSTNYSVAQPIYVVGRPRRGARAVIDRTVPRCL
jgi:hypothetical protein